MKDITPVVRFDLRPSFGELTTPIDDEQNARVWRELALATLTQLHAVLLALDDERERRYRLIAEYRQVARRPAA